MLRIVVVVFILCQLVCGQRMIRYGSFSYLIQNSPSEYSEAVGACCNLNGTLAVFYNRSLYELIRNFNILSPGSSQAYWIGLRRNSSANTFLWADGEILTPNSFQAWSTNEPNNDNNQEDCVIMGQPCCLPNLSMYEWFDVNCEHDFIGNGFNNPGYICQFPGCPPFGRDIVFVIDGSGSVGMRNFDLIRNWIISLAANFSVDDPANRIGVVQYSHYFSNM